jgi:hypothetical protein
MWNSSAQACPQRSRGGGSLGREVLQQFFFSEEKRFSDLPPGPVG